MKLMDKQGRFFGKVHFFDLLIVALLLVGIGGMALRSANPKAPANQAVSATYTFEIKNAPECLAEAFRVGDTLYENGVVMGTITELQVSPYSILQMTEDGTPILVEHPLSYNLLLTVTTDNLINQNGYYIGTQEILNGTGHNFQNGFATATGTVLEISIVS